MKLNLPIIKDRTGWPWVSDSVPAVLVAADPEIEWPKVSIITPSYNQGEYIEETIRSVLFQDYPNLEYIIIDGGSSDNSLEIIKKYESWISHWVSEPDRGQTHAINKGLKMAEGEILAWLNSDDTYLPGAISTAVSTLRKNPEVGFVYGSAAFVNEQGEKIREYQAKPLGRGYKRMRYWKGWRVPQPTLFFRRSLIDKFGYLDETYNYSLDYEWVIRISQSENSICMNDTIATYRRHQMSKTGDFIENRDKFYRETLRTNFLYAPPYKLTTWPLWLEWAIFRFIHFFANIIPPCRR